MEWIKSGIENPSKSEVSGCCGGVEKNRMTTQNRQSRTLKKQKQWLNDDTKMKFYTLKGNSSKYNGSKIEVIW